MAESGDVRLCPRDGVEEREVGADASVEGAEVRAAVAMEGAAMMKREKETRVLENGEMRG